MIHYRIQSTASRAAIRERLLWSIPEAQVIEDSGADANPWRGYQLCLTDIPDCSHVVIVQDDAIVCDDFTDTVERVISARPDQPICLFLHGGDFLRTLKQAAQLRGNGARFVPLYFRDLMPVVAVAWPKQHAEHFLEWSKTAKLPGMPRPVRSDDACAGAWMREARVQVLACMPSIVQHPDDVPSTIGKRHMGGADKGRAAWWFDRSAGSYDWSV